MEQGRRVASRYFWDRYARLLVSMSMQEAKEILGFPPYANPSSVEITKAWRAKAFENHPDRGGDTKKMVEVNVAKDILLNTGGSSAWRPEPAPAPTPRPRPEPPKVVETIPGKKFNEGTTEIPSGVEWKFVSKPQYEVSTRDVLPGSYIWTIVGVTDQQYVVASIKNRRADKLYDHHKGGLVEFEPDWQCNVVRAPRAKPAVKALPALIKSACSLFEDDTLGTPPKKYVLCPEGTILNETMIKAIKSGSGGVPFKDALLASGLIAETDKAVAGRKSVVEMTFKYSLEKQKRRKELKGRITRTDQFEVFVTVNGKQARLEDETVENLTKRFFGWTLSWDAMEDGHTSVITRLKGGRFKGGAALALRALADALTSEPSWLIIALEKASEEWETESKTATLFRIHSVMSLRDAAEAVGMTPLDLFETLHG